MLSNVTPTVHLQHLALKRKQVNTREIQKSFLLKKVFYSELGTLVDELSLDGFPQDPTNICLDPTRRQIFVSLTSQLQTWIQHLSYFSNNFNVWLCEIKPLSQFQLYITKYRQECPKDNWGNAHITPPTRVGTALASTFASPVSSPWASATLPPTRTTRRFSQSYSCSLAVSCIQHARTKWNRHYGRHLCFTGDGHTDDVHFISVCSQHVVSLSVA